MTTKDYVFPRDWLFPRRRGCFRSLSAIITLLPKLNHATFEVASLLDCKAIINVHIIGQGYMGEVTFSPWGRIGMQIEDLSLAQSFGASVIMVLLSYLTSKDYS